MAAGYVDFSEHATGTGVPSGFSQRWRTDAATFEVIEDGGAAGGKFLRMTFGSGGWRALSLDAAGAPDDCEVLQRVRASSTGGPRILAAARGGGTTGSGNQADRDAYFLGMLNPDAQLQKFVEGTGSLLATDGYEWAADTWYWARVRCSGTLIRAKFWPANLPFEPVRWAYQATDEDLASGWLGIAAFSSGVNFDCDVFAWATAGERAPGAPSLEGRASAAATPW